MPERGDRAICQHCGQDIHWVEQVQTQGGLSNTPSSYQPPAGWFHTTHFMRTCLDSNRTAAPRPAEEPEHEIAV